MIKGIGPIYAKKLVMAFSEAVYDVIEQKPERLHEVDGIGPKRADSIVAAWDQKAIREIMIFLHSHGVGTSRGELASQNTRDIAAVSAVGSSEKSKDHAARAAAVGDYLRLVDAPPGPLGAVASPTMLAHRPDLGRGTDHPQYRAVPGVPRDRPDLHA